MQQAGLQKAWQVLFIFFLVIAGVILAKPFLVPVAFAGLFAMLFLPIVRKLERMGIPRALAALICVLTYLFVLSGIILLIAWQVNNLTSDLGNIEGKVQYLIDELKNFISRVFNVSHREQDQILEKQSENAAGLIAKISGAIMSILVDFVLMLVYIFLFLYYRRHLKKFIGKIIPKKDDERADDAISNIEKISQQYLTGMGVMIICLWIMYSIGFTIVGLKNSIFFAMLCGLFEIVPYVGNLTGSALAALMALTQGGGIGMVIGVLITYSIVQFLQTYLLEPLVVGTEVNVNPLFTILGLVVGQLLWGIAGMVLAIPLLGITKIICDHVPVLKPYGFLIGREKSDRPTFIDRIRMKFSKDK